MSTQINQYLIYGAKLDYVKYSMDARFEKFEDNAFDDKMNPNGLHCLCDGMNGDYIYIGRCLKKSSNNEFLSDTEIVPFDPDLAEMTRLLIKSELGIEEDMKLYLVTHYR